MFKDFLSVDELKASALVLALIISIPFALFHCLQSGDIPDNLLVLLFYLITAITGINLVGSMSSKNNNANNRDDEF